ncbi:MAG: RidA family protein [Hyphomicrobiales bacterium]|nr:RidA family protein [Hyphomicrobiales bacterium]
MQDTPLSRLAALGLELPPAPKPAANYVPYAMHGGLLFIAGQLPYGPTGALEHVGRVGADVSLEAAQEAARRAALNILAQANAALGDLGRIAQTMRLNGFVAAAPGFIDMPLVLNGASDLMFAALGEAGRHSRVAVGVAELPRNACVEIDAVFAIR